jgi:CPA1 family monovalent cation:H+ antiporter
MFESTTALVVLAATVAFLNYRVLKLPEAIGQMALSLGVSLCLVLAGVVYAPVRDLAREYVKNLNFGETVLHGLLGFLLFAGALQVNLRDLSRYAFAISTLSIASTILSTILVGCLLWFLVGFVGVELRLVDALLFGALISPTDPIAVLGIVRRAGISKSLETKIVGESLLNDGVAVVIFLVLADVASGSASPDAWHVAGLFIRQTLGGLTWGIIAGFIGYRLFKAIDNYQVEILISLALVMGSFVVGERLHVSAALAIVVVGLLVGNQGRQFAMSRTTVARLDAFWSAIDDILTSVFFVLIGLEMLELNLNARFLAAGALAIPVVLFARWASIVAPAAALLRLRRLDPGTISILTWGALRGGLSVAMALAIPSELGGTGNQSREVIIVMTWVVATFSILVQGLTVGRLARRWLQTGAGAPLGGARGRKMHSA